MLVVKATAMGMCFGVKDALDAARSIRQPRRVTIYGELVHNAEVQSEMAARGFRSQPETRRSIPSTPGVMVTAHGISQKDLQRLESAGKTVLDTTCPLVRRVHKAALWLSKEGFRVLVVGRPGHVEVEGIVGDLEQAVVIPGPEQAATYPEPRLGIVSQTTTRPRLFREVVEAVGRRNPGKEIRVIDTVCRPTRDRQQAVEALIERVQALVVVGGKNSNNTRQLGLLAEQRAKPWLHVQGPDDLSPDWFHNVALVGLTAGTSTPEETIDAVYGRLLQIGRRQALTA